MEHKWQKTWNYFFSKSFSIHFILVDSIRQLFGDHMDLLAEIIQKKGNWNISMFHDDDCL